MKITPLRLFFGAILGTVFNFAMFWAVMSFNGTPVPAWRDWQALLTYPMGSMGLTVGLAAFWYVFSLMLCAAA